MRVADPENTGLNELHFVLITQEKLASICSKSFYKSMKTKGFFLFLISIISVTTFMNLDIDKSKQGSNFKKKESINIIIKVSKDRYLESEPIWIEYLVGIDKKKLKLDRQPTMYPSADLKLLLINSMNDTLKYIGGHVGSIIVKEYPDTLWGVLNLLNFFGSPEKFQDSQLLRKYYLPEDTYNLRIFLTYYVNEKEMTTSSEKISFSVVKPYSEEEKAHQEWLDINNIIMNHAGYQTVVTKMEEFVKNFNNSLYVEQVKYLYFVRTFIDPNFDNLSKEYLINIIKNNPDSYYNYSYMSSLQSRMDNNSEFKEQLNVLNGIFSNTLTNKIIYHEIKGHIK